MKAIRMLLATMVLAVVVFAGQAEYSSGYKEGYKKGHCYGKSLCLEPLAPLAPLAPFNRDTWLDGYNDGFLKGLASQN